MTRSIETEQVGIGAADEPSPPVSAEDVARVIRENVTFRPGLGADMGLQGVHEAARAVLTLLRPTPDAQAWEPLSPGDLFWGVMRASHIAVNAASVLRTDPSRGDLVLGALDQLVNDLDGVINPTPPEATPDAQDRGEGA